MLFKDSNWIFQISWLIYTYWERSSNAPIHTINYHLLGSVICTVMIKWPANCLFCCCSGYPLLPSHGCPWIAAIRSILPSARNLCLLCTHSCDCWNKGKPSQWRDRRNLNDNCAHVKVAVRQLGNGRIPKVFSFSVCFIDLLVFLSISSSYFWVSRYILYLVMPWSGRW